MTFILPIARIGAIPSNLILWNEEKDMLVVDGLIKSPTKEKEKKTRVKCANQKSMCKKKANMRSIKKKPKCAKEGYAKRGAIKVFHKT